MPEVKARDEAAADTKRPDAPAGIKWSFPWLGAAGSDALTSLWRISQLPANTGPKTGSAPSPVPQRVPPDAFDDIEPPSSIDRLLHAAVGRLTSGLSPAALALAYADWAMHLWSAPGKQQQLVEKAVRKTIRFGTVRGAPRRGAGMRALHRASAARPAVPQRGLAAMAVQSHLSSFSSESAVVAQRDDRHQRACRATISRSSSFAARQLLDIFAPDQLHRDEPGGSRRRRCARADKISRAAR